jgi:Tfp pilus tip-associated adhesin PilY1
MWSFTDSKMGETWSEPVIGKIKMSDGSSKYVAFVGGGYDTAANNNSGKAFTLSMSQTARNFGNIISPVRSPMTAST